jgi:hypothetical protein
VRVPAVLLHEENQRQKIIGTVPASFTRIRDGSSAHQLLSRYRSGQINDTETLKKGPFPITDTEFSFRLNSGVQPLLKKDQFGNSISSV